MIINLIYQICITENGNYGAYDVDNGALVCTADNLEDLKNQIDQILIKDTKRGNHNETHRRTSRSPGHGS